MSEVANTERSEAKRILARIEQLRRKLYQISPQYEEDPALHDELDRLIVQYMRVTMPGRS